MVESNVPAKKPGLQMFDAAAANCKCHGRQAGAANLLMCRQALQILKFSNAPPGAANLQMRRQALHPPEADSNAPTGASNAPEADQIFKSSLLRFAIL